MHFALKYLKHLTLYDDVQPYRIYDHPELSPDEQSNCEFEIIQDISAQNLRNGQRKCCLEKEGFEVINGPSKCTLTADVFEGRAPQSSKTIEAYLKETMDLVKKTLGAPSVVAIDWRFRRNDPTTPSQGAESADFRNQALGVATIVHCDFSSHGGSERIQMHLNDDEWKGIENGALRAKVVNVWRPLNVVKNAPLLLSDRQTIRKQDLVEADQVMTDKVTKTAYLYHQPDQQWFWLPDQRPDEAFMFTTWAPPSDCDHADYSPHAAAYLHHDEATMAQRESVEVRMIVLQK